jgi:hypothetical protein
LLYDEGVCGEQKRHDAKLAAACVLPFSFLVPER